VVLPGGYVPPATLLNDLEHPLGDLVAWKVREHYANGTLPFPAVYGVSDGWPHVRAVYEEAGFDTAGAQVEVVYAGLTAGIAPAGDPPVAGMELRRRLGTLGTAFDAVLDGEAVGMVEVDDDLTSGGTNLGAAGWADICNHSVHEDLRRRGIGSWLVRSAAEWLRLGRTSRLLAYAIEDDLLADRARYYARFGLQPINRTTRGFERRPT
jgi:GNAT superfamily N-acetyltransferase